MSNQAAKFRAWQNPQHLHYGGFHQFERTSAKHDRNPMTRAYAGKNTRFRSARTSHVDDKLRLAKQHAGTHGQYQDPKYVHGRVSDPKKFVGPEWSTDFERQDVQRFRIKAIRQSGGLNSAIQRVPSRFKKKQRPRSREYNLRSPHGGNVDPSSRTVASQSSMVYVDTKQMQQRPQTVGTMDSRSSVVVSATLQRPVTDGGKVKSEPSFFRGTSSMFPPLPRHPASYGRQVNVLDPKVAHHLVQKEHRAKVAARQQAMLQNLSMTDIWGDSPSPPPTATTMRNSVSAPALAMSPMGQGPSFGASATSLYGTGGDADAAGDVPESDAKYLYSKPPSFSPPTTSNMRVERALNGRPASRTLRGTSRYGSTAPANAPPPAVLDFSASIDNMRVAHAATSLGRSLRFGESLLDGVDAPQGHPAALPGSAGGMAALSMSSVFSPDPMTWASFAAQPMRPHPGVVKFGPLKCGVAYAFPATVRNHGLVARRLRVAGTHILPESSPADINVRYSSVRLAPGMSATVDIILQAEVPGKIVAQVEMCSEDDYFVIPVTATFLSNDGFQAAMEKSHNPSRVAKKRGARGTGTEQLLIPGATHKFVMVVLPHSPAPLSPPRSSGLPGDDDTAGMTIVEQMEAKLRAAGYSPQPIGEDARPAPSPDAGEGDAASDGGDSGGDDRTSTLQPSGSSRKVGVLAMIQATEGNKRARAELETAARNISRTARGHLGRKRFQQVKARKAK